MDQWEGIKKDDKSSDSSSFDNDPLSSATSSFYSSSDVVDDGASSSSFSSSTDMADDAASASLSSCGPLYELADLMAHLPIKRGLSKFYNGKSKTFGCLLKLKRFENLGKKEIMSCGGRRMNSCKTYGGNLNYQNKFGPKATITKKSSNR